MSGPPNHNNSYGAYEYPDYGYHNAGSQPGSLTNNPEVSSLLPDPGYEPLYNRFIDQPFPLQDTQPYGHVQASIPFTQASFQPNYTMDKSHAGSLPNPELNTPKTHQSTRFQPYPATAPPQLPTTSQHLTSKGLPCTRKPNRTPEEIQAAEAALALKRQERADKASSKAADSQAKAAQKAACDLIKAKDKANAASCLKWTLEASTELLEYVKVVKEEYDLISKGFGFVPFGKYFESYTERREEFPLLADINVDALLRRYRALVGNYKVSL
jgi:hypothetical protein